MIDSGRGAIVRLSQAGISPASVESVFFTHYHSDHTVGFPDFLLTSWLFAGGSRTEPLDVFGPVGAKPLVDGVLAAFADDIAIRVADQGSPIGGVIPNVHEFSGKKTEVVFDKDGVVVTAFPVNHGELIVPAVGYKIEFDDRSLVISGDTKLDPIVIEMARGVDLLIHEAVAATPAALQVPVFQSIIDHHTTLSEAGEVFAQAQPKLAAFTHVVLLSTPKEAIMSPDEVLAETRETYDGPLEYSFDLSTYTITADGVTVEHAQPQR
jgi:ribonuclease Z